MTVNAVGRISRISFLTDMTRADAPVIPLGYLLEGAWLDQARWLGMIGRTRLTRLEADTINLTTWPELVSPFGLLDKLFEQGWKSAWGEAGQSIQKDWSRSAFDINTEEYSLLTHMHADTSEAWTATCDLLCAQLNALRVNLAPVLVAEPIPLRAPLRPVITQPIESRTKTDIPKAA